MLVCRGATHAARLDALWEELARRRLTNVLVEGGGQLLGNLLDAWQIDEVHVFIAPMLVGGDQALSPLGGQGVAELSAALRLGPLAMELLGDDIYLHGRPGSTI